MKEFWLYGAITAALAAPPAHLKGHVEMLDGGGNYSAMVLPVVEGDKQYALLAFGSVSGHSPSEERRIYPLFAAVKVSYPARQVQWLDLHEGSFGMRTTLFDAQHTPYLGVIDRHNLTVDEWTSARQRYPPLVSLVMEREWLLTRHAVTNEERATARELQNCVRVLYDKPLLPYYHYAGRQFFAWMERAAK